MSERIFVKTFRVVGETVTRAGTAIKTLGDKIDKQINDFVAANPNLKLVDMILNTSLGGSTEHAVVTIMYSGKEGKEPVAPALAPEGDAPVTEGEEQPATEPVGDGASEGNPNPADQTPS